MDKPRPGDLVMLKKKRQSHLQFSVQDGELGMIEGVIGTDAQELLVCWHYSAFRGYDVGGAPECHTSDTWDHTDDKAFVSCSGGPAWYVKAAELKPTGRTQQAMFWCWKSLPTGNGGVYYKLAVPVWEL